MADIVQLKTADGKTLEEINALLRQLSERIPSCTSELLQRILETPTTELWVVREEDVVVGMGELVIVLKPEGIIAQIEDVIIDEGQRGKGLGRMISEKLIERARDREARMIQLSSRASREAANALYQKLGFEQHETNVYQMKLQ